MSPHETLFLESTNTLDIHYIANNNLVKFQTWDFGGDCDLNNDVLYGGKQISFETIFKLANTLVYVIDAQEEDYQDDLPKLVDTISTAHNINPKLHFEVFLNKVDGDMSEETKAERQQGIQQFVSSELSENNRDDELLVSYFLVSIYDHSALEAFSRVVQKLVPQLPTLNSLLDAFIASCTIEKSYLVDVVTKLYIATDSNPIDAKTYELCTDLVDVVIDVSHIYGVNKTDGQLVTFDDKSTAAIRLNTGLIFYLREVSHYLALICVIREEHFVKRSLLDYNINCFRNSLSMVFKETPNEPAK
jgi:Ras-related GTP-binding protein C/D